MTASDLWLLVAAADADAVHVELFERGTHDRARRFRHVSAALGGLTQPVAELTGCMHVNARLQPHDTDQGVGASFSNHRADCTPSVPSRPHTLRRNEG